MNQQQRMKMMKDLTKKIRSKGRIDVESRWWVIELLAADCEKAWIHLECLENMKKEGEKKQVEEMNQQKVTQTIYNSEDMLLSAFFTALV